MSDDFFFFFSKHLFQRNLNKMTRINQFGPDFKDKIGPKIFQCFTQEKIHTFSSHSF